MSHKRIDGTNIFLTLNGDVIGDFQSADLEFETKEREIKNGDNLTLLNKEFTCTLEDIEISEELIGELFFPSNKTFTVVGVGYKLPRGNRLPKKKRIRRKWMKKYSYEFKLEDCIVTK